MKRAGSARGIVAGKGGEPGGSGGAIAASRGNAAVIDSGIATLQRAKSMDGQNRLEEAFVLYEGGIDLLLQGARDEPVEQRRQTLLREVSVHMARAENIKAALAPPVSYAPARGGGMEVTGGRGTRRGRGQARGVGAGAEKGAVAGTGRGRPTLSRPTPSAADVRGSTRGGGSAKGRRGTNRGDQSLGTSGASTYSTGGGGRNQTNPRTEGTLGGGGGGGEKSENSELEEKILEDMLDGSPGVTWDSISGLEYVKQTLQETVILPNLRPDLFTGLRAPSKGVLLYGPPGTGKTMLAKAVATESGYAFFNISASSLTSKYVGEGEKMVRALFAVARKRQPAVIFIDEIDSVLSARGEGEHEASRRLKTEFLVQLDGVSGGGQEGDDKRLLVLAATNLPQELDEAALRRLSRRVYVPLPDPAARKALLSRLLGQHKANLRGSCLESLVGMTEGYSGSDLKELCKEAAMQPIRDLGSRVRTVAAKDVRGITLDDFRAAVSRVLPSVSKKTIDRLEAWERSLSGL